MNTNRIVGALALLPLAVALTACKPATKVADLDHVYTVDEFSQDIGLRQKALAACSANPGELRTDPNCVNAIASHVGAAAQEDQSYAIKRLAAAQDIAVIATAVKLYKLDNGAYPTQAQGLQALIEKPTTEPIPNNWKDGGYLTHLPNDPWGRPYQIMNPGNHGYDLDVYSFGPGSDTYHPLIEGSWQDDVRALEKTYVEKGSFNTADQ
ncbi:type II secretion system major pseudopilin GspG [Paraburkholderia sp. BR10936]|uniref:type II secretion system major pseudopilin GspG n=1 Tax=Paraburkholderia sp. BR10936 TaxID=3236993 RepID=UPI0034D1FF7E